MNNPPSTSFKKLDLSDKRHVFVVGDIHGCFTMLETQLKECSFDPDQDVLLSVGDLVDRGPESHRAIEFIAHPWFHFVRGNHEQMCQEAPGSSWHCQNGGAWINELSREQSSVHIRALNMSPIIIEALLPNGKRIGLIHASYPSHSWDNVENYAEKWTEHCMWSRDQIKGALSDKEIPFEISGIDHIYFGHTPLKEVFTSGNASWIDTGACFPSGKLSIIQVC